MANRSNLAAAVNETRVGTTRPGNPNGVLMVETPAGKVSVLAMNDTAGETWFAWFDTSGNFRIHTAEPTAPNSDGTIVGTQS